MKNYLGVFILLLVVYVFNAQVCCDNQYAQFYNVYESSVEFVKTYKKSLTFKTSINEVFMPIGVYFTLTIAYFASRENTTRQLNKVINYPEGACFREIQELFKRVKYYHHANDVTLTTIYKVFVVQEYQRNSSYEQIIKDTFNATVSSIGKNETEFEKKTNKWIKTITNNDITRIFEKGTVDKNTSLIFSNAVHFQGKWFKDFYSLTNKLSFYDFEKNEHKVEGMATLNAGLKSGYVPDLNSTCVFLPYHDSYDKLVIIMPGNETSKPNVSSFDRVGEKLKTIEINNLILLLERKYVNVYMPKFKVESSHDIMSDLEKMHAGEKFNHENNFDNIFESSTKLNVTKIVQTVSITVADNINNSTNIKPEIENDNTIVINKPFYFAVISNDELLFLGKIILPQI